MIIELLIHPLIVITIVLLNCIMFLKLRQSRKLSKITSRKWDSRAEKVLTVTMILLLFPVIINSSVSMFEFFDSFHYYVYLIRPFSIDAQAHFITCYFYFTHPIFKKKEDKVVTVRSGATC
uniref:G_PROTEIN_RECEP_F1_2 domain-containing protein n=1 Tax=Caenorhabditis tropicalis TaxID=1561998 RepID=A0A1I7UP15_9PELO